MASTNEPQLSKRPHVKTERMQEFIRSQGEASSPKKLKCPHQSCDRVFTSNPGLKYHMQTHSVREPQFSCRKCHRVFKSANGLKYHTDKTKCDLVERDSEASVPAATSTSNDENHPLNETESHSEPLTKPLPAQLMLSPAPGCSPPNGDMDKLRELAIIATSPLLQKHKSPWQPDDKPTKPSGGAIRSLEKLLNRRCDASDEDAHLSDTDVSPAENVDTSARFCGWHNAESLLPDGSDPRVSSSSPLCISPDEAGGENSTWSHTWPTAVWLCFIKGTRIKFLQLDETDWQLVDMIAEREELQRLASINKTSRYAEKGLCIRNIREDRDEIDQSDIEVHFSPCLPHQPDILARCQRDHPFFVKDKGWSSRYPLETVEHYGIPCSELCTGDVCLPQSRSDAAASEEIFIRNLEEHDLTPEDTYAVLTLSCMKQRKDSDLSPPPGSGSQPQLWTVAPSTKWEPEDKAKRPMNAFMLFAQEQRRLNHTKMFPKKDNRVISVMLGEQWKQLSSEVRQSYEEKSKQMAERQKLKHPDCWKRKK